MAGSDEIFDNVDLKQTVFFVLTTYLTICIISYIALLLRKVYIPKYPRKILVIIAHPDDECMFFAPSIQAEASKGNFIYLLCLTTGDYYGAGDLRKRELVRSCDVLGIPERNIKIVDHKKLHDSMTIEWDREVLDQEILLHIYGLQPNKVITFDSYGVSGHINHRAIYHSIHDLCTNNKIPKHTKVYVLRSISILRKYTAILDLPFTYLVSNRLFVSSPLQAMKARRAMLHHRTQMVWFRWLYIIFSRYMYANDLKQVCHHGDC